MCMNILTGFVKADMLVVISHCSLTSFYCGEKLSIICYFLVLFLIIELNLQLKYLKAPKFQKLLKYFNIFTGYSVGYVLRRISLE